MEREATESDQGEDPVGASMGGGSSGAPSAVPAISVGQMSGSIVVPSPQQFEIARVEAREAGRSQDLHRMVSAMQAAAAKCDLAYEEMVRLAVYRLEVERDLGVHLAQTVARGRPTKRCPRGTISGSGLPEGISKKQSVAYQRLAAIPVAVFKRYLEAVRGARRFPTTRGAQAFASEPKPRVARPARKARAGRATVDAELLESIRRCLGDIDVVVGESSIPARRCIGAVESLSATVSGQVLVVAADQATASLPLVSRLVAVGTVAESVVLLPRDLDDGWPGGLRSGRWSVCMPVDSSKCVVAYAGARSRAFKLVFDAVGPIFDVQHDAARLPNGAERRV